MAAFFTPVTTRIQLPTRRYRTKKRSIDHCFVFILNLRVNMNKHNQLWTWSYNNKLNVVHVKVQFSVFMLRSLKRLRSLKNRFYFSIVGQFKIYIKIFSQRFIYTVQFVNLNIKNAAESKQGIFETTEVLRWALTTKLSGCACLNYKRHKKFVVSKTGASRLMVGKEVFSIS